MSKRNLVIFGIVALVTLLAVPLVYAQQAHGPRGMRGFGLFGHLQRLQTELALSDAQVTDIKAIFTNLRDQNAPYRDQLKGNLSTIATTLLKDPGNVAAAQTILDQQAQAEHAMKTNMLNATAKAFGVFTPEQRAKLAQIIADRQARRAGRAAR